ncbi:hypothetical protein C8J57DRAFT_1721276 [Mycena rebaudengoi]|nr:hypothetical protein C8J57DRAFT_1721276 [Mycena rebaudengoi]
MTHFEPSIQWHLTPPPATTASKFPPPYPPPLAETASATVLLTTMRFAKAPSTWQPLKRSTTATQRCFLILPTLGLVYWRDCVSSTCTPANASGRWIYLSYIEPERVPFLSYTIANTPSSAFLGTLVRPLETLSVASWTPLTTAEALSGTTTATLSLANRICTGFPVRAPLNATLTRRLTYPRPQALNQDDPLAPLLRLIIKVHLHIPATVKFLRAISTSAPRTRSQLVGLFFAHILALHAHNPEPSYRTQTILPPPSAFLNVPF